MSLTSGEDRNVVRRYFDERAWRFDSRYADQGGIRRLIERTFRRSVYLRYAWAIGILSESVQGRTVLDAGCGSGRYCVALAKAGARRVVGVDVSERMLELATEYARASGVLDRCEFVRGDFLALELNEEFDFSLAMGFFDYAREPAAHVRKLAKLTRGESLMSFPVRWHWLTPQRKLRYLWCGVRLRFYTRRKIVDALRNAGLVAHRMDRLARDFVVSGVRA